MGYKFLIALIASAICVIYPTLVSSHGRLMDPPNRSSLWRFEEFQEYEPEENFEDNQLFCGGALVQHQINGGRCGECGDSYNATRPRDNENGGFYGRGIIARNYTAGHLIDIWIELTAFHLGHFEIRLCPLTSPTQMEDESCFLKNVLKFANGLKEFPVTNDQIINYFLQVQLPEGLSCERCVIQWHYLTGNSWGLCPNGTDAPGCGPQETFRGCADVTILPKN